MYRLHIDIPMETEETAACAFSEELVHEIVRVMGERLRQSGIEEVNYRLGHDEDRQRSNYLIKTPSGHVVNKKSRIHLHRKETHD